MILCILVQFIFEFNYEFSSAHGFSQSLKSYSLDGFQTEFAN